MKLRLNFFNKDKNSLWFSFGRIIFRISFITFIVLFITDYFLPGFVTNYFNPIWLLIIAVISGIIITDYD